MEQFVPSFQDFVKQIPPVLNHQKPLTPHPLVPRRASSSSLSRSRTPSCFAARRSSSVYSRTISQWASDHISWRSADFADDPIHARPLFLPLAFSASTPDLEAKQPAAPPSTRWRYSPLWRTPSRTTASEVSTSGSTHEERFTVWPSFVSPSRAPNNHNRTVSLQEAKAALHARGAVNLLPEELRAKTARRSRSQEGSRMAHGDMRSAAPNTLRESATLVDKQGRRRTIISSKQIFAPLSEFPIPVVSSPINDLHPPFKNPPGPEREMAPLVTQQCESLKHKVVQAFGLDEFDEPRGRTRHRGPRNLSYAHYLPNGKSIFSDSNPDSEPQAQKMAKEYCALLSEEHRKPASSPSQQSPDYDNKPKDYMRLVPQPLFYTKPPAKLPEELDQAESEEFSSPYSLSSTTGESGSPAILASTSGRDIVPPTLSSPLESGHRRGSTSGTIPISPPEPMRQDYGARSRQPVLAESKTANSPPQKVKDSRVSAFYPHVASRKGWKTRKITKKPANRSEIPPMPFLSTSFAKEKIQARGHQPFSSSHSAKSSMTLNSHGKTRKKSDASTSQPFHQRVVNGAVNLVTNYESPNHADDSAIATTSPDSSRLLTSPVNSKPKDVHLGWSDVAKSTFDKIVSPTKPSSKAESPHVTHIVARARLLDESVAGLKEAESRRRKSSIFGVFLDSWKESKAEKRREELKRIIRYVSYADDEDTSNDSKGNTLGRT